MNAVLREKASRRKVKPHNSFPGKGMQAAESEKKKGIGGSATWVPPEGRRKVGKNDQGQPG